MRYGLVTPIVTLNPARHNAWERDATVDDLVAVARAADRLGYHHLTASEHVAVPTEVEPVRGARYWDPLATLSYVAAHTERLRLATHVLVLGYHHPAAIAKRYGTLDHLSGGRLILGVGVGTLREEFELLGAQFEGRGAIADARLRALHALLGRREPDYEAEGIRVRDVVIDPPAVQAHVPVWVGGRSRRSLRRALALGDGWVPFGAQPEELEAVLHDVRDTAEWEARDEPLELVFHPPALLDPGGEPEHVRELVGRYGAAGATLLNVRLRHESRAHGLEQLEALVELDA